MTFHSIFYTFCMFCLYTVQLANVRNQLLEVQTGYDKIQNELKETKTNDDALLHQKEKELELLKADIAKYQVGFLHACYVLPYLSVMGDLHYMCVYVELL